MSKEFQGSYTMNKSMLETEFEKYKSEFKSNIPPHEKFELFTSGLVFKHLGIHEDPAEGLAPSGSKDGGVDRAFFILNSTEIISLDSDYFSEEEPRSLKSLSKTNNTIDIIIIQAKEEATWDQNVFSKMRLTVPKLLDLELDHNEALESKTLSESALEVNTLWKKFFKKLNLDSIYPKYRVHIYYTSLADENKVGPELEESKKLLSNDLKEKFVEDTEFRVETLGAYSLWKFSQISDEIEATIEFDGQSIRVDNAFLGLVKISDYLEFITTDNNKSNIRHELFARNIRTFAGTSKNKVNSNILSTLSTSEGPEFWWLNNGVTIVADEKKDIDGKRWKLINPSVVNGLQTSYSIHEQYSSKSGISEKMLNSNLMVRVVVSSEARIQDEIIGCTNSQTAIDNEYIHANDEIQKRIEAILRSYGWDYERRAYQYKNQKNKITIKQLIQAVNAYRYIDPYQSRNQPARLMTDNYWKKIFSDSHEDEVYLQSIIVYKAVESYLSLQEENLRDSKTNLRYYLISAYTLSYSGVKRKEDFEKVPTLQLPWAELIDSDNNIVNKEKLVEIFNPLSEIISTSVDNLISSNNKERNPIFKNSQLQQRIFEQILHLNKTKDNNQ